jgi:hypothetical protein
VQTPFVAPRQVSRQRTRLAQAHMHDPLDELLHVVNALEVDPLRFQV